MQEPDIKKLGKSLREKAHDYMDTVYMFTIFQGESTDYHDLEWPTRGMLIDMVDMALKQCTGKSYMDELVKELHKDWE